MGAPLTVGLARLATGPAGTEAVAGGPMPAVDPPAADAAAPPPPRISTSVVTTTTATATTAIAVMTSGRRLERWAGGGPAGAAGWSAGVGPVGGGAMPEPPRIAAVRGSLEPRGG